MNHNTQDLEYEIEEKKLVRWSINKYCCYYTNEQHSINKLSVIHFNCESLCANFNHTKEYLNQFSYPFNVIAISETWINMDTIR